MTEATTMAVIPEGDATPLVRLLTQTIRTSLEQDPEHWSAPLHLGSVVVTSASDAQVATVTVTDDRIYVTSGADASACCSLTVDLVHRLEVVDTDADGNDALVSFASRLLRPSLPAWQEAARAFWALTGSDVGMPRTLVVENSEDEGDSLLLGNGLPRYVVHGSADRLAGVFTGADSFLDEVFAGNLKVRGTLPQLSVMAGASFKVRFYV